MRPNNRINCRHLLRQIELSATFDSLSSLSFTTNFHFGKIVILKFPLVDRLIDARRCFLPFDAIQSFIGFRGKYFCLKLNNLFISHFTWSSCDRKLDKTPLGASNGFQRFSIINCRLTIINCASRDLSQLGHCAYTENRHCAMAFAATTNGFAHGDCWKVSYSSKTTQTFETFRWWGKIT